MKFIADLHIHSRFSRATAKNLDLENLHIAAQLKGITVVGTGDFTHPGWFSEIREKLVPAEEGLFKLKDDIAQHCDKKVPRSCRAEVRFILETEISNIYKKNKRTRKNHNLVFVPDLEVAENFIRKLDNIGNIRSDGRPILGLDARNLLEILIETSNRAFLVPAHIWTPWFSLLGSKSGFDSVEECFEDLTPHIFAVETGLSSDPAMNWRVSALDGLTLISNSDAHSPLKLGREANIFNTELDYDSIKSAIETGDPRRFLGTFEFYPEEGKYHLDGHRKCNVRLWPETTRSRDGICPLCERPLTLGVLYRVEELSDRPEGVRPEKSHPYYSVVPLTEVLSEILRVGPGSKKVMTRYHELLEKLGPEFRILNSLTNEKLDAAGLPLLAEAISRIRGNNVVTDPGFDGEFGKIKVFDDEERERLIGQKTLFVHQETVVEHRQKKNVGPPDRLNPQDPENRNKTRSKSAGFFDGTSNRDQPDEPENAKNREAGNLNAEQLRAVGYAGGPVMIVAGPGTGKTHTLTHRIANLVANRGASPDHILAVTFTNKAAEEMRKRLRQLLGDSTLLPWVGTFHSLCFNLLSEQRKKPCEVIDDRDRRGLISDAVKRASSTEMPPAVKSGKIVDRIMSVKQKGENPGDNADRTLGAGNKFLSAVYDSYQYLLSIQDLYDYEDLIIKTARLLENDAAFNRKCRDKFRFVFVDEYQDLNHWQYRIIRALKTPGQKGQNLCVIGDPDQSIYGFRGSSVKYFNRFVTDYPDAEILYLTRSYRSTQTILDASYQVVNTLNAADRRSRLYSGRQGSETIAVLETASEKAEAVAVGKTIERLVGGTGFHAVDFGKLDGTGSSANRSFSDFAILFRTADQGRVFSEVFETEGIPYQVLTRETIFNAQGISEILSMLKILADSGSFADLERVLGVSKPSIARGVYETLKEWSYEKGFSLSSALTNARRFPIAGLTKGRQVKLNDFLTGLHNIEGQAANMTIEEKIRFLLHHTRLDETLQHNPGTKEALDLLIEISRDHPDDPAGFFAKVALQSDTDIYRADSEKVALMTMHAAKGLEFPVVFVVGCETGYLPFQKTKDHVPDVDEERRLFYVAMTRAQERLYLTFAKKRRVYGKVEKREESGFVGEIERRLLSRRTSQPAKPKKEKQAQLKLF